MLSVEPLKQRQGKFEKEEIVYIEVDCHEANAD